MGPLKSKQTSITTVRYPIVSVERLPTPLIFRYPLPLRNQKQPYPQSTYIEYNSVLVCPHVGIGTPPWLMRVCPPPRTKGGGGICACQRVRGWVSPNSNDWRKSLALCLLNGTTHRVHLFTRDETGLVCLPIRWSIHCNFSGDGKCATPPSPNWANFTLMMECTPESCRCYSVYSVALP